MNVVIFKSNEEFDKIVSGEVREIHITEDFLKSEIKGTLKLFTNWSELITMVTIATEDRSKHFHLKVVRRNKSTEVFSISPFDYFNVNTGGCRKGDGWK